MSAVREAIENQWIADATLIEVDQLSVDVQETPEDLAVTIELQLPDDDVELYAFALLYALSALSFHDARPRGFSEKDFEADDGWSASDMLSHLKFERGSLHLYADYVRGRMLKTDIQVRPDGHVTLRTIHRGRSAERWVRSLQGKRRLQAVPS